MSLGNGILYRGIRNAATSHKVVAETQMHALGGGTREAAICQSPTSHQEKQAIKMYGNLAPFVVALLEPYREESVQSITQQPLKARNER